MCLRCEWAGASSAPGRCPRCGVPLYETEAARATPSPSREKRSGAAGTGVLEAEVVERRDDPVAPPPRARRRWALPLLLLVLGAAVLLLPRQDIPQPQRPGVANPPPATLRFIGLPRGLSDRTVDHPVRIAFSASHPAPERRAQVSRLWRLDLPTGELTPGPIVGQVAAMRYAPGGSGRLAFLEGDGGLYALDGFLASRPTWVDGEVSAFDFSPDGTLVYAKVERRTAPTGRAEAVVRLGMVEPERTAPTNVRSRTIRNLNLRGFTVRGWHLIAWGVRGGSEQAVVWSARSGDLRRASGLRLTPRTRSAAGFWVLGGHDASLGLPGAPAEPAHLAIDGELMIWAAGRAISVADPERSRAYVVQLPARLPTPTGPIAAASGADR